MTNNKFIFYAYFYVYNSVCVYKIMLVAKYANKLQETTCIIG